VPTPPVQATPFRVNADGEVLPPVSAPLKPNETDALVAMLALYPASRTLTAAPDWLTTPFHSRVTVCPDGKLQGCRREQAGDRGQGDHARSSHSSSRGEARTEPRKQYSAF
jgi:hypothetical protein